MVPHARAYRETHCVEATYNPSSIVLNGHVRFLPYVCRTDCPLMALGLLATSHRLFTVFLPSPYRSQLCPYQSCDTQPPMKQPQSMREEVIAPLTMRHGISGEAAAAA